MRVRNLDFLGYPNYEVDDQGNVYSLNYLGHPGIRKMLKPFADTCGYLQVVLFCNNGKKKTWLVHQLVLRAFDDWSMWLDQINHKDENKKNNILTNLEWCSAKFNSNWGTRNERISKAMKGEKNHAYGKHLTEEHKKKISEANKGKSNEKSYKKVNQYTLDGTFLQSFNSMTEASKLTGIKLGNICSCIRGKRKSAGNFVWRYKID